MDASHARSDSERITPRVEVLRDDSLDAILRRCVADVMVRDRDSNAGRGFTNLKRIFGSPGELRTVVAAMSATVAGSDAVASVDSGSAPLAALVAYETGLPAVFVRSQPKRYFVSYGADPSTDNPLLSGERLASGTRVHLIDDLVHSGSTLATAASALREAGLVVTTATCLLAAPPDSLRPKLEQIGLETLIAFAITTDL